MFSEIIAFIGLFSGTILVIFVVCLYVDRQMKRANRGSRAAAKNVQTQEGGVESKSRAD